MELYLSHSDLPIVLTRPGLFEVPVATVGSVQTGGTQPTAPDATVAQGTTIPTDGTNAGQLTVRRDTAWPEVGNGSGQLGVRYRDASGAWHDLPGSAITRGGTDNRDLTITFPETARTGNVAYEIFTGSGGSRTYLADGTAPFATRTATDGDGTARPGQTQSPPTNEALGSVGGGTGEDTRTALNTYATNFETTTGPNAMRSIFNLGSGVEYWSSGTTLNPANFDQAVTDMTAGRDRVQALRDTAVSDLGTATTELQRLENLPAGERPADYDTQLSAARTRVETLRTQVRQYSDSFDAHVRGLGRASSFRTIYDEFRTARTALDGGDPTQMRDFRQRYDRRTVASLGNGTVMAGITSGNYTGEQINAARTEVNRPAGGGNGGAGTQSAGFTNTVHGINQGINAVAGTVHSAANVTDALGRLTRSSASIPPNSGFGYGGFGGGYGFGGGFGFGGFGPMGMMGPVGQQDQREESRKITMLLQMLMHAIQAGNTDAIGTALTFIAMRGKKTLLQAAARTVRAMESFERQQQTINNQMANLNAEGNRNYQSQMMTLTNDMNVYSSNRQAIVNFLRDVKGMVDELDNMDKSWRDVAIRQQTSLTRFA